MIQRKTKLNPTDHAFLKTLKIKKLKISSLFDTYNVARNGEIIASVDYNNNIDYVYSVWVDSKFRRKGIANFLYDYIEKKFNIELKPSDDLLYNGQMFWMNRLSKKRKPIRND